MNNYSQPHATTEKLPWERAAYLRALIEAGSVQVAPDQNRLHHLPGGQRSMLRVSHTALLTRPDPAQAMVGAMTAFIERGFDDHAVVIGTLAPASAHLTGAVAHVLGIRQGLVGTTPGQPLRFTLPANLGASPASAIIVITDMITPADAGLHEALKTLRQTLEKQKITTSLYILAGVAREPDESQRVMAEYGAALHYLLPLRALAIDSRLRASPDQRRLLRREFA